MTRQQFELPPVLQAIATRADKRAPMDLHTRIYVDAASGLAGDAHRKPGRAQVSIVSAEKWADACAALGADLPWTLRRANLLVSGVPLEPVVGKRLSIGSLMLEVTMETDPCERMDEQHAGLKRALETDARGGVRCRIVQSGWIGVGDPVRWPPDEEPGEAGLRRWQSEGGFGQR